MARMVVAIFEKIYQVFYPHLQKSHNKRFKLHFITMQKKYYKAKTLIYKNPSPNVKLVLSVHDVLD
jgi:hypothetical protein